MFSLIWFISGAIRRAPGVLGKITTYHKGADEK